MFLGVLARNEERFSFKCFQLFLPDEWDKFKGKKRKVYF